MFGLTDVESECNSGRQDEGTDELDEDDELHTEAEGTAQVADEHELHQVVHGRVDPAAALREEDLELVRDGGFANGLRNEDLLAFGEGLEHEGGQVAVLAEQEQVLLVQRVDDVLGVVLDDVRVGEDGDPVVLAALGRLDAVHTEAAGQTGDTTEDGFERLALVVGNEVLEDLDHGDPRVRLVCDLRLTAETHDLRILDHSADHVRQRIREDLGIGVDHECNFVEVRRNASDFPDTVEHLVLQFSHTLVEHHLLQERHEDDLRVALATVTGLSERSLLGSTAFDDDHHRNALLPLDGDDRLGAVIVETRVDLSHVVTLAARSDSHVGERLDILRSDGVVLHHGETDFRCRQSLALTLNQTVTDHEDELVTVRVVGHGDGIHRGAHAFGTFRVGSDETDGVCKRVTERLPLRRRLRDN